MAVTGPPRRAWKWKEGSNEMLALKYLLMVLGVALFGSAGALAAYDIYLSEQLRRLLSGGKSDESGAEVGALARRHLRPVPWRLALQLAAAGGPVAVPPGGAVWDFRRANGERPERGLGGRPRPVARQKRL